jgi:1-deoxy-D-xylulose-5-phosphate reductoisomerase
VIFLKKIAILGSTGSIGRQTLDVISNYPDLYQVVALSAGENVELLRQQIKRFKPKIVSVKNTVKREELLKNEDLDVEVLTGETGMCLIASLEEVDLVVVSVVGIIGLKPTLAAISSGKTIALANKETLVTAGELVMQTCKQHNVNLLPVDSEHSAIFQCLQGENVSSVSRLILTASGGPFRTAELERLKRVTVKDALRHPNWSMGKKITIDSATMMNKGLEVIEARWLFNIDYEQIEIVVHPQSIIHSMVEFVDGSVKAQLSNPDMRLPIQYALFYPERKYTNYNKIKWGNQMNLSFEPPNFDKFPCLKLAYWAGRAGKTYPTVLNAANEIAVDSFLKNKISFLEIPEIIERVLEKHTPLPAKNFEEIQAADEWARLEANKYISK